MAADLPTTCPNVDCSDGYLFRASSFGGAVKMYACNRCERGRLIAEQVRYRPRDRKKRYPWRIPMWRPRFSSRASAAADRRVKDD